MKVHDVNIQPVQEDNGGELADKFYRCCGFCNKLVRITAVNLKSCVHLSGRGFYCPFCLRHNFHHKSNRHVLILSYRAIIAHYYYRNYLGYGRKKMWVNEIRCCIKAHQSIGLQNPVFCYDPITYLWFIDFSKVGQGQHKAPVEEVLRTAQSMLRTFDLKSHYSEHTFNSMWDKYEKAIRLFHTHRKRPKGKRMLIPTLSGCATGDQEHFEKTRDFLAFQLELK